MMPKIYNLILSEIREGMLYEFFQVGLEKEAPLYRFLKRDNENCDIFKCEIPAKRTLHMPGSYKFQICNRCASKMPELFVHAGTGDLAIIGELGKVIEK